MTLQLTDTPDRCLRLSADGRTLARLQFHLYRGGADLFDLAAWQANRSTDGAFVWEINPNDATRLELKVNVFPQANDCLVLRCSLTNTGPALVRLDGLVLPELSLDPVVFSPQAGLWALQGAATGWGQDFAFELPVPYTGENYLGHLQDAEGGGIPLNYFWNANLGLGLMHIEPVPQEWYLPVYVNDSGCRSAFEYRRPLTLAPGQQWNAPQVVISSHQGDFFEPLALYRELIGEGGVAPAQPTPACFEPAWCSWGYEFDVTPQQVLGVLPALDELGIHWLTLDDRWFDAYGDWNPRPDTFPGGADDMRHMNERLHAAGKKNQIWWYPLCAEDGHGAWDSHTYGLSRLLQEHPEWVVRHEDGSVARNNRHLAMLCPALPEVQAHLRSLTELFIAGWGFDGHKLDNIYTMPACYNPAHRHAHPEESIAAFGEAYRIIFETTRRLRPDSVTQICPCGTPLTHSLMPCTDQTVTADPTSSAQIRQRIKFYKALMGPAAAVFADHVELSDGGVDFASEIGAGGVPATKFIYPADPALKSKLNEYWDFPPQKAALWKKWFDLYNRHRPAMGTYLNLYDLAYHIPEAHVIQKGTDLYYAFYAPEFAGEVELRGLEKGNYRLLDYVNEIDLGIVSTAHPRIHVNLHGSLLLWAHPCA